MRQETITYNIYQFDELSDDAKENARDWWRSSGLDYEWWDSIGEDLVQIGCKLVEFDIDRGSYCKILFNYDLDDVAEKIIKNHGENCDSYQIARQFLSDHSKISIDENAACKEFSRQCRKQTDLCSQFKEELSESYLVMLRREYDYIMSDESVDESIRANEYEFTSDGKVYA